jgi:hypothetical protein
MQKFKNESINLYEELYLDTLKKAIKHLAVDIMKLILGPWLSSNCAHFQRTRPT